ncbi:MAG: HEAT repeat domain-containing protein [Candidatus Riflebacteria bacterium]|nr:HEAT repeat domain-containing protein [Candidatus Riflebacteria bacterium]
MPGAEKNRFKNLIDGLKSGNSEEKLLSVSALGILGIKQHADHLKDLLSSPDQEIVDQVVKALGRIGNPTSVKHIVEFIVTDNGKLAETAFTALKSFDFLPAIDVVIKACSSDQPIVIRRRLLELLASYDDVRVASLMNEILGQTRDPDLLTAAVGYFVRHPSAERHTSLKMLSGSDNWSISLMANLALSRLKDEGASAHVRRLVKSANAEVRQIIAEALVSQPLIEDRNIFQALFEDARPRIREIAVEGLALFGSDERISILRRCLSLESDHKIKLLLLKKAEKEKSTLLYEEFYKLLQVSDDQIRNTSINAIAAMGERIADRIIIDFDRMPLVVREQMILVLGQIGGDKVVKIFRECLTAKERWLRINAVDACSRLGSAELDGELIKILQNSETDIWVRATAVSALRRSKNSQALEIIATQLKHDDARVRANAVEALSELKWPDLPVACKKLLHDRNDRVRVNSAIALWKSGNQEVFGELEKMARDRSRWVRSSAVFALGRIHDHQVTPILLKMLHDSEDIVYRNAIEALAEQGDLRAMLPLLKETRSTRLSAEFYERSLQRFTGNIHSDQK